MGRFDEVRDALRADEEVIRAGQEEERRQRDEARREHAEHERLKAHARNRFDAEIRPRAKAVLVEAAGAIDGVGNAIARVVDEPHYVGLRFRPARANEALLLATTAPMEDPTDQRVEIKDRSERRKDGGALPRLVKMDDWNDDTFATIVVEWLQGIRTAANH